MSLTCFLCKLTERMMDVRLMLDLERLKTIYPDRYGFRQRRNTIDVLAYLDTYIKIVLARKEHAIAVFLDLEWRMILPWSITY